MNSKDLEIILEKSLVRLEAGIPLQKILEENRPDAAELEPLLRAAAAARSLPAPDYQRSIREGRNRLLAEADRMVETGSFTKNETKSNILRYSGQWMKRIGNLLVGKENIEMKLLPRLALYGLMTVLVAGFFTVNASASSLPGDALYGLKIGWEQTQLALTFNEDSRQELENEFEDERLDEVEALLGSGREEDVEFHGLIESKADGTWIVSGITVFVDAQTELKGALELGDQVKVEALTQYDGSLLAIEVFGEGADGEQDLIDDSDDGLDDDSSDDIDDDSNDDIDDDSSDDMDDDSSDDVDDDSNDDIDDDSSDDMSDNSDDDMDDDSGDDTSGDSGDDTDSGSDDDESDSPDDGSDSSDSSNDYQYNNDENEEELED